MKKIVKLFGMIFYCFFFSFFSSGHGEPTYETDAVAIQTNSNDFNYITIAGKGIRFIKGGLISETFSLWLKSPKMGANSFSEHYPPPKEKMFCGVIWHNFFGI